MNFYPILTAQPLVWDKEYRFFEDYQGYFTKILQVNNGDLFLAGYAEYDYYEYTPGFMRIDSNGTKIWDISYTFPYTFHQEITNTLVQKPDVDIFYSFSFNPLWPVPINEGLKRQESLNDCWLIKINGNGDTLLKKYSTDIGWVNDLLWDNGYLVAVGSTNYEEQNPWEYHSKATILVLDTSGNVSLRKEFLTDVDARASSIIKQPDGGYYVVGAIVSYSIEWGWVPDGMFLVEFDPAFNHIWTYISEDLYSESTKIIHCSDGNFAIIGDGYNPETENRDIILWRLNADTVIYQKQFYDISNSDYAYSLKQTNDSGFIFCGSISPQNYSYPAFFYMKTNKDGMEDWQWNYGYYYEAFDVILNGNTGYYVVGHGIHAKLVKADLTGYGLNVSIDDHQFKTGKNLIKIYPNPAYEEVSISLKNTEDNPDIIIQYFNDVGRKVFETKIHKGQKEIAVDVAGWQPGLYIAMVTSQGKVAGKEKFVVMN
ncbi:MAG: T9SS type A sorting domain-containing protein [Bacteroidetes bacterium]|nr:T9SS type A sorting domain-containing protein [Bacteroidota bacterium]